MVLTNNTNNNNYNNVEKNNDIEPTLGSSISSNSKSINTGNNSTSVNSRQFPLKALNVNNNQ